MEKIDNGFLDTPFVSLRATRKPGVFGLRVAKRIEKTDIDFSQCISPLTKNYSKNKT
jgi:hypothetical protein